MIGKLTGIIDEITDDHIILDVHGVGYRVFLSSRILQRLVLTEELSLFIETYIREDMQKLFGFSTKPEREWFRVLQNVQGIGAKAALGLLSSFSLSELSKAILSGNVTFITKAPGIGKKMAERLITELKNKSLPLDGEEGLEGLQESLAVSSFVVQEEVLPSLVEDVISALCNLGYEKKHVKSTVLQLYNDNVTGELWDSASLIRACLRSFGKN